MMPDRNVKLASQGSDAVKVNEVFITMMTLRRGSYKFSSCNRVNIFHSNDAGASGQCVLKNSDYEKNMFQRNYVFLMFGVDPGF